MKKFTTKTAFIRAYPNLTPKQVETLAATQGIEISNALVSTLRYQDKKNAAKSSPSKPKAPARKPASLMEQIAYHQAQIAQLDREMDREAEALEKQAEELRAQAAKMRSRNGTSLRLVQGAANA